MHALGQVVFRQIAQYTGASNLFVLRGGAAGVSPALEAFVSAVDEHIKLADVAEAAQKRARVHRFELGAVREERRNT